MSQSYKWNDGAKALKGADPRTADRYSGKAIEGARESNAFGNGMSWDEFEALIDQALNEKKKKVRRSS